MIDRFLGYYEFVTPTILVRDIELLKKIAIQDFESFFDHRVYISEEVDPIFGRTVFVLRGTASFMYIRYYNRIDSFTSSHRYHKKRP